MTCLDVQQAPSLLLSFGACAWPHALFPLARPPFTYCSLLLVKFSLVLYASISHSDSKGILLVLPNESCVI